MLELFKCKNFFPLRGVCVGYPKHILPVLTAIDLASSNSPFSGVRGKTFGAGFYTPQGN